jgi:hypothetical protein
MDMRDHIRLVGWLHVIGGGIFIALAVFLASVLGLIGVASGAAESAAILVLVGTFLAVLFSLLALPSLLGGWGLLKGKGWARVLVIVLSFLNLANFPLGTLMGGYSLWVLLNDESRRLLEGAPRRDQLRAG